MREILMSLSQERKNPESRFTTYEKISFIVSKEIQLCHVTNPQLTNPTHKAFLDLD